MKKFFPALFISFVFTALLPDVKPKDASNLASEIVANFKSQEQKC
jgi:hypothetical protein